MRLSAAQSKGIWLAGGLCLLSATMFAGTKIGNDYSEKIIHDCHPVKGELGLRVKSAIPRFPEYRTRTDEGCRFGYSKLDI